MNDKPNIFENLLLLHDEVRLQIHLATMDAQQEWERLEEKWKEFSAQAELEESAEHIGEAFETLGEELRASYERIRRAL